MWTRAKFELEPSGPRRSTNWAIQYCRRSKIYRLFFQKALSQLKDLYISIWFIACTIYSRDQLLLFMLGRMSGVSIVRQSYSYQQKRTWFLGMKTQRIMHLLYKETVVSLHNCNAFAWERQDNSRVTDTIYQCEIHKVSSYFRFWTNDILYNSGRKLDRYWFYLTSRRN